MRSVRVLIGLATVVVGSWGLALRTAQAANTSTAKAAAFKQTLLETANAYLGEHYVYGDIGESGYDCSSFVQTVFRQSGWLLPRSSREQVLLGKAVSMENIRPGDLLFFTSNINDKRITHVGIALPNNRMIHAAKSQHRVVISRWDSRYFLQRWFAARRLETAPPVPWLASAPVAGAAPVARLTRR